MNKIIPWKDWAGHDRSYAIDNAKITTDLGWAPAYTFEQSIAKTIQWYLDHQEWMDRVTPATYLRYYSEYV